MLDPVGAEELRFVLDPVGAEELRFEGNWGVDYSRSPFWDELWLD